MLYYQIPIDDFVSGSMCLFDVYARKKDGFYFHVLKNEEPFNAQVIKDLSRNGNRFVYIPMADKTRYLSFCSKLARIASEL